MDVEIHRRADLAVPEDRLYVLRPDPRLDEERAACVPQIVEPQTRVSVRGDQALRIDVDIATEKARRDKLHAGMTALLLEIQRLGAIRGATARRAMWEESYPPDAKPDSIGARIAAVIRGVSAENERG